MYEKDKKKGEKKRKGRRLREPVCVAGEAGEKKKRDISIRISRRRKKAYLLVSVYIGTYTLYYIFICIIFFLIISYMRRTVL